jgi:hypothetical protein
MSKKLILLWAVLLLAFGLRVAALEKKAVWWDEAWSVWTAQQSWAETTKAAARDVHPPLFQWILHGWVRVAGISELAVRMLSVFAGLLTTAVVYPLARRMGGSRRAALLAMFLTALSAFHIRWSQETRMYALAAFWAALACYVYMRADETSWRWWVLLLAAGIGLPLTHYLGSVVLLILNLHWLLTGRSRTRIFHRRWVTCMAVIALAVGAWGVYAYGQMRSGGGTAGFSPGLIFRLSATLLAVGQSVNLTHYTGLMLAVTLIFLGGLALVLRRNRSGGLLIGLAAFVPPLVVYILSYRWASFYAPKPEERYFVIFIPILYVGLGLALDQIGQMQRLAGRVIAAGLILLYGYFCLEGLDNRYFRDDYRSLMAALRLLVQPGEPVFFISGDRYPLVYYNLERVSGGRMPFMPVGVPSLGGDSDAQMQRTIGETPRFWLIEIEASLGDPKGERRAWIDQRYERIYHAAAGYNSINLYTRDQRTLPDSSVLLPPVIQEARPGDTVRIGVPGGLRVDLLHKGQVIASQMAGEQWQLLEFPIYPVDAPGDYVLRAGGNDYHFRVTHSQPVPAGFETNLNVLIGPLRLLGYRVDQTPVRSGQTFEVTFYWRAEEQPRENYTVFFHLLGPFNPASGGIVWDVNDGYPAGTPTTAWWPGLVVYDRRKIHVPATMPPGTYSLEVGLYRLETGDRLLMPDGADHLVINGIKVRR